ncbi:aminotransferase class I/II-fold pyridoxal phosphate-dependent enzyme [Streptococcus caprae]|uniref:Aminotransferase class I/II-fold pyridoxal phosphate-dependent enzyme n=1 Tax=Streptococcus caprae TaxID=1640501 RepID=A0ABV8CXP9_9STRE
MKQERMPIVEALKALKERRVVPFDVPGHKRGRSSRDLTAFLGEQAVSMDANSMKMLDNLGHPVSVIKEAEELAAEAFGAHYAFFMVNGTIGAVQNMIFATIKAGDKIILPRNVHKSVINALVMCGGLPVYVTTPLQPELEISTGMPLEELEKTLAEYSEVKAVLVNNPTYYGICSDLRRIVDLTENHGVHNAILDTSATCHMPDVLEMPYRPDIIGSGQPGEKAYTYRFGGPTCLAGDIIGDYSFDQPLEIGSRLIFCDMAIYSMVKTNTFNGMPLATIMAADGDNQLTAVKSFGYEEFKRRLS